MEAPKNIYPLAPPPNNSRFCRRRYPVTDWNIALLVGVCMRLIISFWSLFINGATISSWMYYFILQPSLSFASRRISMPFHVTECFFVSHFLDHSVHLILAAIQPQSFWTFWLSSPPIFVLSVKLCLHCSSYQTDLHLFSKFPSSPFHHIYQ